MPSKNSDADHDFSKKRPDSRDVSDESAWLWLEQLEKTEASQRENHSPGKKIASKYYGFSDEEETVGEIAAKGSPPWLFSIIVHLLLLILLALLFVRDSSNSAAVIDVTMFAETKGEQLESLSAQFDIDHEPVAVKVDVDMPIVPSSEILPTIDDLGTTAMYHGYDPMNIQLSDMLRGRVVSNRGQLLKAYGGNETTEEAVQRGLKWLAKNQIKREKGFGYWSLKGPYSNGGSSENTIAATAMALIAFQGNGHTHQSRSEYRELVDISWNWLLKQQSDDGAFGPMANIPSGHRFYTHALATIALCEIYGMTNDRKFQAPARRAIDYFWATQGESGGWRYHPMEQGDLSVTGWCVIALKSAQMAKINVPEDRLDRIRKFLDGNSSESGSKYSYLPGDTPTPAMTAEGLLARQFLGWKHNDPRLRQGAEWLTSDENLVDYTKNRNSYYWYYSTQVMHHLGGKYWMKWNNRMRQEVPMAQVRDRNNPEFGSWSPLLPVQEDGSAQASAGGRLYITCLSIYMLEVYYRHLPIYREAVIKK